MATADHRQRFAWRYMPESKSISALISNCSAVRNLQVSADFIDLDETVDSAGVFIRALFLMHSLLSESAGTHFDNDNVVVPIFFLSVVRRFSGIRFAVIIVQESRRYEQQVFETWLTRLLLLLKRGFVGNLKNRSIRSSYV